MTSVQIRFGFRMYAYLLLSATGLAATFFAVISEGTTMPVSQELTVYVNQNLTLSCQPSDSPSRLVYWYKIDRKNKSYKKYISNESFYTIAKATVNDAGIYSCYADESGKSMNRSIMVNVIDPPIIVSSSPNSTVIAGHSITLWCKSSHQNISWYKEGSDTPMAKGKNLTIYDATVIDEGTYYCAEEPDGPRGSLKVLVIVPPVITDLKVIVLKNGEEDKREVILLCETGNRHPVEYAWIKDGSPLASKANTVNVSLEGNEASGKFECHVTNLAGIASKSLSIDPIGKTADMSNKSYYLIIIIAVLSVSVVLSAISCFVCGVWMGKIRFKKKLTRKVSTQISPTESSEGTSVEITVSEDGDSRMIVPRSPADVTRDTDNVFPYEVAQTWTGRTSGPYTSLRRGENTGEYEADATQVRKPDYVNISPSNRNDSAANCLYVPLFLKPGGNVRKCPPYANVDNTGV